MNYSIQIDHSHQLILYKHTGDILKDDIGLAWQDLLNLEEFTTKGYHLLSDYTESKFIMKEKEIAEITSFLANLKPILRGKKQALVLSEPMSTALSMLFASEVIAKVGFVVEVFSTTKAATLWLTEK